MMTCGDPEDSELPQVCVCEGMPPPCVLSVRLSRSLRSFSGFAKGLHGLTLALIKGVSVGVHQHFWRVSTHGCDCHWVEAESDEL